MCDKYGTASVQPVKKAPRVISLRLTKGQGNVIAYAKVESRSRSGESHNVVYTKTHGWDCGCENYMFTRKALGESCAHIDAVKDMLHETILTAYDGILNLARML